MVKLENRFKANKNVFVKGVYIVVFIAYHSLVNTGNHA